MLILVHGLNTQQLRELDELCARCYQTDGNIVAIYRHLLAKPRPVACNVLYYIDNQLVGFLRPFFFFEDTCEIALMVDPSHRRHGIAHTMLDAVTHLVQSPEINKLIFSVPHDCNQDWLSHRGFVYENSEYKMQWQVGKIDRQETLPQFTIRQAVEADVPTLCDIDLSCFTKHHADLFGHFAALIHEEDCDIFLILENGVAVGKTHLFCYTDGARLTDIAVLPAYRGQGLASRLIAHCIDYAITAHIATITLDVETNNKNALNLYTRLGFEITNAHDYWSVTKLVDG